MKYLIPAIVCMLAGTLYGQELNLSWQFQAGSPIYADPAVAGGRLYVGSEDGVMYALDLKSGKLVWEFKAEGHIKAKAVVANDQLYFESANIVYALHLEDGSLNWKYQPQQAPEQFIHEDKTYLYQMDFFDDIRSAPVLHQGKLYLGSSHGGVLVLDASQGKLLHTFRSQDQSAVRSTPLIEDNVLYFGDWNGIVYAYHIETKNKLWQKSTYRFDRPYNTFGGIISSFVSHSGKLYFGARNYQINVLWAETGEKEWTYTDPKGGWICGDPVLFKDTVYWGGSDNFSMYSFHAKYGHNIWQQVGTQNILKAPTVTEDLIIYGAGNWYDRRQPGYVQVLDRKSGSPLFQLAMPQAVFSKPVLVDDVLVFGCLDGHVYGATLVHKN